ncbi:YbfB/YjiJ family MFS transporter [Aquipseudomonas ullengensis]|uniref:YbfB/YjiJ family MFS transporter n=1 Tax=Aquipseudomonas ullengensis TaxID=2759166 RepID=A0A7W4LIL6_9GAMM|nr:YbfB/YjiJ family MFS transporter [Pseudomonas ullengensis]MBB2493868.1 YbfB/YjiJ family MFS transporter [Pseudomonas ullengensis]
MLRTLAAPLAAALLLAIGMGFGRFAFTGLYPLMLDDGLLSLHSGSLAASANYAGYLIGALLLARSTDDQASRLCQWALAGTLLSLAAMACISQAWLIVLTRFAAGLFSAMALVGASLWLLHAGGQARRAPLLFAGVGLGILLSAQLIAAGHAAGLHSQALWLILALGALMLGVPAWLQLRRQPAPSAAHDAPAANAPDRLGARRLVLIYGLAGFGYIVTATYLPLLLQGSLGAIDPLQIWAAFGLGAIPSCFLWHALQQRLGTPRSLALNLLTQALGVVLPVFSHAPWACLGSAVLVGATFMGTVTIAMPAARTYASRVRFNLLATMTAAYGLGQIIGPLLATVLFSYNHSFNPALLVATAALVAGAALCRPRREPAT